MIEQQQKIFNIIKIFYCFNFLIIYFTLYLLIISLFNIFSLYTYLFFNLFGLFKMNTIFYIKILIKVLYFSYIAFCYFVDYRKYKILL